MTSEVNQACCMAFECFQKYWSTEPYVPLLMKGIVLMDDIGLHFEVDTVRIYAHMHFQNIQPQSLLNNAASDRLYGVDT